ncbi:hypothetical protein FRC07_010309, partial [Ceratobasidium sp. 392]
DSTPVPSVVCRFASSESDPDMSSSETECVDASALDPPRRAWSTLYSPYQPPGEQFPFMAYFPDTSPGLFDEYN